jgi:hypothetical protein
MKIQGPLAHMLLEIASKVYAGYWTYESSLLYYRKFCKDIESIGVEVNPCDPCVANRIVNGKQH